MVTTPPVSTVLGLPTVPLSPEQAVLLVSSGNVALGLTISLAPAAEPRLRQKYAIPLITTATAQLIMELGFVLTAREPLAGLLFLIGAAFATETGIHASVAFEEILVIFLRPWMGAPKGKRWLFVELLKGSTWL